MFASFGRGFSAALEELKKSFSHKKKTMGMIVIPLVFIFLLPMGLGNLFEEGLYIDSFSVAVVNEDQHPMAHLLMEQIRGDEDLQALIEIVHAADGEAAEGMVRDGAVFAGVVIPEDFVGSLERGENRELILYTDPGDPFKSQVLKGIMESFMYSVSAGQSGVNTVWDYYREQDMPLEERRERIDPVISDITFRALHARDTMLAHQQMEGINTMNPGVYYLHSVIFSLLLFAALFLGRDLMEEQKQGLFLRIPFTGTALKEYYGGKILGRGFRMTIVAAVLIAAGQRMLGVKLDFSALVTLFYLSLWILVILTLAALFSQVLRKPELFLTLGNFFVYGLILLGGGLIPYYYLPFNLGRLAGFFPHYHYLRGIQRITISDYQGLGPKSLLMVLGALLVFGLGVLTMERRAGDRM